MGELNFFSMFPRHFSLNYLNKHTHILNFYDSYKSMHTIALNYLISYFKNKELLINIIQVSFSSVHDWLRLTCRHAITVTAAETLVLHCSFVIFRGYDLQVFLS